jgi:peptidoglycan/LPS O-acetylase OafA/YrhL
MAGERKGPGADFYERRALRILPPYAAFLLLATFSLHLQWDHNALWYALFAMNFAEVFQLGVRALAFCGPWQSKSSSISFGLSWLFAFRLESF